jgi:uncharacterized protein (TIGR02270 family)
MNPESPLARHQEVHAIIPEVVSQYADEVATLYSLRTANLQAPHIRLRDLRRAFDDRIVAHLVGLAIAGKYGWAFCEAALEAPSAGAVFTAAVRAIEEREPGKLDRLLALSEAVLQTRPGLYSAFGWVAREQLQGIVVSLLDAEDAFRRAVGIVVCSMHRVDSGLVSARRVSDADPLVRACALRSAGEIGCDEAVPACTAAMRDVDPECRFWAAWSSVLLGDRGVALRSLAASSLTDTPHRLRAFRLALQAMNVRAAHDMLRPLADDPGNLRWLMQGTGIAGDPLYVRWLIDHMTDEQTARLAGEAFTLITGIDLAEMNLERKPPEDFESGPTDNPEDENVAMDPDDGLPWPDVEKIEKWWGDNAMRFQPGTRYFMGAPVTRKHCVDVLKTGYQRQRILAAHYLCLLDPGAPLFNTSAPAWRQQRLLAKM